MYIILREKINWKENYQISLNIFYMPNILLNTLYGLCHLILITALQVYCYSHFMD